ncbi:hypothetical protein VIGAN_03142900 [Vigna angularis var. angularis]|uniref:Uncharacterized protein n=1 Tax=Vigna angularis var. angularis TaxID=157739 RepID=A0A0S3RM19_PHAAN|nr:hypothetical protein VIGAN_03142900 [Vigna angularis var. angularis]
MFSYALNLKCQNSNVFTSSHSNLKQYLYIYLIPIYKLFQNPYFRSSNKINFSQQTHSEQIKFITINIHNRIHTR